MQRFIEKNVEKKKAKQNKANDEEHKNSRNRQMKGTQTEVLSGSET